MKPSNLFTVHKYIEILLITHFAIFFKIKSAYYLQAGATRGEQWTDLTIAIDRNQLTDANFVEEIWGVGLRAKEDDKEVVRKEELVMCLKEAMEGKRN